VATEEGKAIIETATEGTQEVMEEAGNQARQVVDEVGAQIKKLAEQGQAQLRLQAEQQTQRASKNLWTLAEQAEALADGRVDEAGPFPGQIRRVGSQLSDAAGRIDRRGFDGLIDDARTFARRRPAAFIGLAAVAGFAVSRIGRTLDGQKGANGETGASRAESTPEGAASVQDTESVRWSGAEAPYLAESPDVPAGAFVVDEEIVLIQDPRPATSGRSTGSEETGRP